MKWYVKYLLYVKIPELNTLDGLSDRAADREP